MTLFPDTSVQIDSHTLQGTTGVLTVDLEALAANWKALESRAVPAECAAVVKADAYACGIKPVTRKLASVGCKTFFVATLDEARCAREAAPRAAIYVLDGFFANCGDDFAKIDCRPVIGDLNELAEWDAFRRTRGWTGLAALQIDTGMNRLGVSVEEARGLAPRIRQPDHGIALVMSHLACAEDMHNPMNARQLAAFRSVASEFSGVTASLTNSSGIFLGSQFHMDMVRPGCALYGVNPTPEADNPMQPVVSLKVRVAQIRNVPKGETVGYGAVWHAKRPTRLAIVSAGYADGYFRAASGIEGTRSAQAVAAGQRCPIAGRISMDLMAIDITDLPNGAVRRGHFITLIGDGVSVDELGHHFGTIGYEVLTSLGRRFARDYRGNVGPDSKTAPEKAPPEKAAPENSTT
jgi:alanine racemase